MQFVEFQHPRQKHSTSHHFRILSTDVKIELFSLKFRSSLLYLHCVLRQSCSEKVRLMFSISVYKFIFFQMLRSSSLQKKNLWKISGSELKRHKNNQVNYSASKIAQKNTWTPPFTFPTRSSALSITLLQVRSELHCFKACV